MFEFGILGLIIIMVIGRKGLEWIQKEVTEDSPFNVNTTKGKANGSK